MTKKNLQRICRQSKNKKEEKTEKSTRSIGDFWNSSWLLNFCIPPQNRTINSANLI